VRFAFSVALARARLASWRRALLKSAKERAQGREHGVVAERSVVGGSARADEQLAAGLVEDRQARVAVVVEDREELGRLDVSNL